MRNPLRMIAEYDVSRFDNFWPEVRRRAWLARCDANIALTRVEKMRTGHKRTWNTLMCAMVELDKQGLLRK